MTEIRISAGGKTLPSTNIEFMNSYQEDYLIFPYAITIDINSTLTVEVINHTGAATLQEIGLLGFILEPEGRLVRA